MSLKKFFLVFWTIIFHGREVLLLFWAFFDWLSVFHHFFLSFNLQKCSDIGTAPDLPNKYLKLWKLI